MTLYKNNREQILQEYPLRIRFQGERAIDLGGVARDMFSAFYEEAYKRIFDGSSLLCPIVHPEMGVAGLLLLCVLLWCLRMIEEAKGQNPTQERILGYLRQYI